MRQAAHHMKLHASPFEKIKSGEKTIELRLFDQKRQQIKVGDTIVFTNTSTGETLRRTVYKLHRFESFDILYKALPLLRCGYTTKDIHRASPGDMLQYYSVEEQAKYGVVGIELLPPRKTTRFSAFLLPILFLLASFAAGVLLGQYAGPFTKSNTKTSALYQSKATIYIDVRSTAEANANPKDSQDLKQTYETILRSSQIAKRIEERFPGCQYELALELISGNMYAVIASGKDPEHLQEICNTAIEQFPQLLESIIERSSVKVIDSAGTPVHQ